mmetsp:Transcript_61942/g.115819  ORF Transcript_61942/g.115819 Transcript_61942/m.115819 type:complete len:206 (+) Transcript_61942:667-1284(+)
MPFCRSKIVSCPISPKGKVLSLSIQLRGRCGNGLPLALSACVQHHDIWLRWVHEKPKPTRQMLYGGIRMPLELTMGLEIFGFARKKMAIRACTQGRIPVLEEAAVSQKASKCWQPFMREAQRSVLRVGHEKRRGLLGHSALSCILMCCDRQEPQRPLVSEENPRILPGSCFVLDLQGCLRQMWSFGRPQPTKWQIAALPQFAVLL